MPKAKKKETEKAPEEVKNETATPEVAPTSEESKKESKSSKKEEVAESKEMPTFEGVKVKYILKDNRSTKTHFHCKMADHTTKHVPRELFV